MKSHLKCLLLVCLLTTTHQNSGSLIKIEVEYWEAGVALPLKNAEVICFDEKPGNGLTLLTDTEKTNGKGKVELNYQFVPNEYNFAPNIYCKIEKENVFTTFTKTKVNHDPWYTADFGIVRVYPDRVARGDAGRFNGCGVNGIPEFFQDAIDYIVRIEESCENHDVCYENCAETQSTCDVEFRFNGASQCNELHNNLIGNAICQFQVVAYYTYLLFFGAGSFESSQIRGNCTH